MSDTPELQEHFGQSGGQQPGCGFPVAHVMGLFHAGTGMALKMLCAPLRTNDLPQALELHPALRAGDVLVGGRGFCSSAHLALLAHKWVHAVFRVHQKQMLVGSGQSEKSGPDGVYAQVADDSQYDGKKSATVAAERGKKYVKTCKPP